MNFNTAGLKNIHVAQPMQDVEAVRQAPPERSAQASENGNLRARKAFRAPREEFTWRIEKYGAAPEPLPEALAAILMQTQKRVTVQANGIEFDLAGKKYRYWHENSVVCRPENVGQKILITFDPDMPEVIYALSDAGEFMEAIPKDGEVEWFGAETGREIERRRGVARRVHDELKRDHALTTRQELDRATANAEAIQFAATLPHQAVASPPGVAAVRQNCSPVAATAGRGSHSPKVAPALADSSSSFSSSRAARIEDAVMAQREAKADFMARREATAKRLAGTRGDLSTVLGDRSQVTDKADELAEAQVEAAEEMSKIF